MISGKDLSRGSVKRDRLSLVLLIDFRCQWQLHSIGIAASTNDVYKTLMKF